MLVLGSLSPCIQSRAPTFGMGVSTSPQLIYGVPHGCAQGFVSMVIKKKTIKSTINVDHGRESTVTTGKAGYGPFW